MDSDRGILRKTSRVLLLQVLVDVEAVVGRLGEVGGYKAAYLWSLLPCVVDCKSPRATDEVRGSWELRQTADSSPEKTMIQMK